MRLRHLLGGAFTLLLLPLPVAAQSINVYPGPDAEWNYLYDYGDVEVGQSGVMIFQIENDATATDDLIVSSIAVEAGMDAFEITGYPSSPVVPPGDSVYVEVTFTPGAEGFYEGLLRIISNASNIPPGPNIRYYLQGTGVEELPTPLELMEEVVHFFKDGVAGGDLYGLGQTSMAAEAHLRVFKNALESAEELIASGDYAAACDQLERAAVKADGVSPPPDFVGGTRVDELHSMIVEVMNALGC